MAWGGADTARVLAPPPLMFLVAAVAGVASDRLLRLPPLGTPGLRRTAGLLLFATGAGLMIWTAGLFNAAGTNVMPNKPTTALVTAGPFRWSRNPGYVGQALAYFAVVARFGSAAGLALFAPLIHLLNTRVIEREEAYLQRLFGDAYRRYRDSTPRWL